MPGQVNHKLESIAGGNINNLFCRDDTTLMAGSQEEQKSLWWGWKRRVKSWLKTQYPKKTHSVRSYHFMANRWGNCGNLDFIFLGSKINIDGGCSHKMKRCLLLGRKAKTNLNSVLKTRDITLPTKIHIVKAMVFPVVTYGCKSLILKKAEHWKICFRAVVLEKTCIVRRAKQSILEEINPEYSL